MMLYTDISGPTHQFVDGDEVEHDAGVHYTRGPHVLVVRRQHGRPQLALRRRVERLCEGN